MQRLRKTLSDLLEFAGTPLIYIDDSRWRTGIGIVDLMMEAGAAKSRSDAKRQIRGGGVYICDARINDVNSIIRWL